MHWRPLGPITLRRRHRFPVLLNVVIELRQRHRFPALLNVVVKQWPLWWNWGDGVATDRHMPVVR
jgi:hypothetical protein